MFGAIWDTSLDPCSEPWAEADARRWPAVGQDPYQLMPKGLIMVYPRKVFSLTEGFSLTGKKKLPGVPAQINSDSGAQAAAWSEPGRGLARE